MFGAQPGRTMLMRETRYCRRWSCSILLWVCSAGVRQWTYTDKHVGVHSHADILHHVHLVHLGLILRELDVYIDALQPLIPSFC